MIHIACCFDKNLEVSFAVLANSIETHSNSGVTMHVIHDGPVEFAKSAVQTIKGHPVKYYDASHMFKKHRTLGPQTPVTFARLHLHEFLEGVARVIYLDVDMIVRRDLMELFTIDLRGAPLAAVLDYPLLLLALRKEFVGASDVRLRADRYISHYLGMKNPSKYLNTGLLVIDLPKFGASGAQERAETFLSQKAYRCIFNDQDALNVALDGNFEVLDPRWNFVQLLTAYSQNGQVSPEIEAALELCDDPWIVHFAGPKPWMSSSRPGRWDGVFWKGLFELNPLNKELVSSLVDQLVQGRQRAHASHEALLRSPARLAGAWWRAFRWKLGVRRAPSLD